MSGSEKLRVVKAIVDLDRGGLCVLRLHRGRSGVQLHCSSHCQSEVSAISLVSGGFKENKVSVANVLSVGQTTKQGKVYYEYEILTRTADGDEGGRHHLISVAASNGKLYTFIGQAGDKRWFKVCSSSAHPTLQCRGFVANEAQIAMRTKQQ